MATQRKNVTRKKTKARSGSTRKKAARKTAAKKKATRKAAKKKAVRKATRATKKRTARKTTRKKAGKKSTKKTARKKTAKTKAAGATRRKSAKKKSTRKKTTRKRATTKNASRKKTAKRTATKTSTRKKSTRKKATRAAARKTAKKGTRKTSSTRKAAKKTRKTATKKSAAARTTRKKSAGKKTAKKTTKARSSKKSLGKTGQKVARKLGRATGKVARAVRDAGDATKSGVERAARKARSAGSSTGLEETTTKVGAMTAPGKSKVYRLAPPNAVPEGPQITPAAEDHSVPAPTKVSHAASRDPVTDLKKKEETSREVAEDAALMEVSPDPGSPIPPEETEDGVERRGPSQNKTAPTDASVEEFLESVEPAEKRRDAFELLEMMREITGERPQMWGTGIVGFGRYHYKYESGREGDWFLTGFSPRKQNLTIYVMSGFPRHDDLMQRLGRYSTGKSCLYVKRLSDVDRDVLRELVERSARHVAETSV